MRCILFLSILIFLFGCMTLTEEKPGARIGPDTDLKQRIKENKSFDPETKGTVIHNGIKYTDECVSQDSVKEYSWENGGVSHAIVPCGSGLVCSDGRCVGSEKECTDTDYGKNYTIAGVVQYRGQTFKDTCKDNFSVIEYYCDGKMEREIYECLASQRCVRAACVKEKQTDEDQLSERQAQVEAGEYLAAQHCGNVLCFDADQGKDFDASSYVCYGDRIYHDHCIGEKRVKEHYCSGGFIMGIERNCGLLCYNGACLDEGDVSCGSRDGYAFLGAGGAVFEIKKNECISYDAAETYDCSDGNISHNIEYCLNDEMCYQGKCIKISREGCFDLDEKMDGIHFRSWAIKTKNGSIFDVKEDECLGEATVKEYGCDGDFYHVEFLECPKKEICIDGRCVYALECIDSDEGVDLNPGKATIFDGGDVVTMEQDGCFNETSVSEAYCTEEGVAWAVLDCPARMMCDEEKGLCYFGSD